MKRFGTILHLLAGRKLLSVKFIGCSVGVSISRAGILWLIQKFLKLTLLPGGTAGPGFLYIVAAALFVVWLVSALFEYGSKVFQQELMRAIEFEVFLKVIRHFTTLSARFFDRSSHGDLLTAALRDIVAMREIVGSFCTILVSAFTTLSFIIVAFATSPSLAFWGLLVLPVASWPVITLGRRIRQLAEKRRTVSFKMIDLLGQIFRGIRLIKVYQAEEGEAKSCERLGSTYYNQLVLGAKARATAGMILEVLAGLGMAVVVTLGGFQVIHGTLEWPSLLAVLLILISMKEPIKMAIHAQATYKEQLPSLDRLDQLFSTTTDVPESPNAVRLERTPSRLIFENVGFAYDDYPVFRDINLSVKAGETIGIAGPSGCGKTTFINLIPRFFDPTLGRILYDGVDLREICLRDVMSLMSIVTQDPFLFNGTIRENILYGRAGAMEEDVLQAARAANVHDEILALPQGYDTVVGVGGANLSGGQRQRINIARALLKNSPILILDEATSSLDSVSEIKVQQAIERLMQGRTSFIISHRLSALRNADRILVLAQGGLEAVGSHEELLKKSPTYALLWETQSKIRDVRFYNVPAPEYESSFDLPEA